MKAADIAFHPEAMKEFAEAYRWYADRGAALGAAFLSETERALRLLREAPLRWVPKGNRYGRLLLRRFPFALFYTVAGETVFILAVAHCRRKPGYWKKRG